MALRFPLWILVVAVGCGGAETDSPGRGPVPPAEATAPTPAAGESEAEGSHEVWILAAEGGVWAVRERKTVPGPIRRVTARQQEGAPGDWRVTLRDPSGAILAEARVRNPMPLHLPPGPQGEAPVHDHQASPVVVVHTARVPTAQTLVLEDADGTTVTEVAVQDATVSPDEVL